MSMSRLTWVLLCLATHKIWDIITHTKIDYLSFLLDAHRYSALAYSVLESEGDASELTGVTGAKPGAKVKKVCTRESFYLCGD